MPATSSTPTNPAPVPIPLPQWQSPTAPCFNSKNPSTLCTYLSNYESLVEAMPLTPGKHLTQSTGYLTEEDKVDWENLPELRLPSQTGMHSRRPSSGSIPKQGNIAYCQLIWATLLMKNPSERSIPWMNLP